MRILVDSNILLRTVERGHPQHSVAVEAADLLRAQHHDLVIVPQNLYEFWVVATRPPGVNGLGMTVEEADQDLWDFLRLFTLLRDERAIYGHWILLVTQYHVKGTKAHDARLVAAMDRHEITRLLTFNTADFMRYQKIVALTPDDVVANGGVREDI